MDKSYDPTSELKAIKALYEDAVERNGRLKIESDAMAAERDEWREMALHHISLLSQAARIADPHLRRPHTEAEAEICKKIAEEIRALGNFHEPKSGDHNPG